MLKLMVIFVSIKKFLNLVAPSLSPRQHKLRRGPRSTDCAGVCAARIVQGSTRPAGQRQTGPRQPLRGLLTEPAESGSVSSGLRRVEPARHGEIHGIDIDAEGILYAAAVSSRPCGPPSQACQDVSQSLLHQGS
jgi:hypothetical protein